MSMMGVIGWFCGSPVAQAETTADSNATEITSVPQTISASGTYYLKQDFTLTTDTAYAINITAPNVTLDFNGHTIAQNAGTNSSTIGVYVGADNVTLRNGTISGCLYGVNAYANNCVFEDLFIVADTFRGMDLTGSNLLVRRCRINNIGGETVPNLAPYALGIVVSNGFDPRIIDCDITTLTYGPGAYTDCILANCVQSLVVSNNRLSAGVKGIESFNGTTGKYADNLCADSVLYPYNSVGSLVDAGNNQ